LYIFLWYLFPEKNFVAKSKCPFYNEAGGGTGNSAGGFRGFPDRKTAAKAASENRSFQDFPEVIH
jgi:hypothetical protein